MKKTKTALKKLEDFLSDLGIKVRYEKGHFQAGYCLLQERKVVLVNKFFDTEARVDTLLALVNEILRSDFLTEEERDQIINFLADKKMRIEG